MSVVWWSVDLLQYPKEPWEAASIASRSALSCLSLNINVYTYLLCFSPLIMNTHKNEKDRNQWDWTSEKAKGLVSSYNCCQTVSSSWQKILRMQSLYMSLRGDWTNSWKRLSEGYKKRQIMQGSEHPWAKNRHRVAKLTSEMHVYTCSCTSLGINLY